MSILNHPHDDIRKAGQLAMKLHSGVVRWFTDEPYYNHVERVGLTVMRSPEFRHDPLTIIAGVLHDAVEDTDYTLEDVAADFPFLVGLPELLDALTHKEGTSYEDYLQGIKDFGMRAVVIKRADMCDNMATLPFHRQKMWDKYTSGITFLAVP